MSKSGATGILWGSRAGRPADQVPWSTESFDSMRFTLLDRITLVEPGKRIQASKCLTLSEQYLEDHFPRFPVMPGVLMLESLYQAAAWLVRVTDHFEHSLVVMAEANNVKYSDFVEPGETLMVTAEMVSHDERFSKLKCEGEVNGTVAVRARLVLERYSLAQCDPDRVPVDRYMIKHLEQKFRLLYPAWVSEIESSSAQG